MGNICSSGLAICGIFYRSKRGKDFCLWLHISHFFMIPTLDVCLRSYLRARRRIYSGFHVFREPFCHKVHIGGFSEDYFDNACHFIAFVSNYLESKDSFLYNCVQYFIVYPRGIYFPFYLLRR